MTKTCEELGHMIDDYGCFDCFMNRANELAMSRLDDAWLWEDAKEQITNMTLIKANDIPLEMIITEEEAQRLSKALADMRYE